MTYVANCTCRGVTPLFDKTPRDNRNPPRSPAASHTLALLYIAPYHPNEARTLIGVFSATPRTVEEKLRKRRWFCGTGQSYWFCLSSSISAHGHLETASCGNAPTVSPTHRAAESRVAFRLSSEGGIRKARVYVICRTVQRAALQLRGQYRARKFGKKRGARWMLLVTCRVRQVVR